MKQTKTKLLYLLLAALMLLSLTACGKNKESTDKELADSNLLKLGDYELLYKGACIMEDSDGNDAVVLTLDFTNNGEDSHSYLWSISETAMQNGAELAVAIVYSNPDSYDATVIEDQFTDVAPGVKSPSIPPHSAGNQLGAVRRSLPGPETRCSTGGMATGTAGGS